MDPSFDKM
jgi:ADP-ribosylation factor 2-binding protein